MSICWIRGRAFPGAGNALEHQDRLVAEGRSDRPVPKVIMEHGARHRVPRPRRRDLRQRERFIALVTHGTGRDTTVPLIRDRCEWFEAVPEGE